MMMIEWTDATTYSQGQRGKVEPTTWECKIKGIRVWISNGHRSYPEEWVMNCHNLGLKETRIGPVFALTTEEAQAASLTRVASEASRLATKLIEVASVIQEATK